MSLQRKRLKRRLAVASDQAAAARKAAQLWSERASELERELMNAHKAFEAIGGVSVRRDYCTDRVRVEFGVDQRSWDHASRTDARTTDLANYIADAIACHIRKGLPR
jgi:predicted site-specific integrase-resolvase